MEPAGFQCVVDQLAVLNATHLETSFMEKLVKHHARPAASLILGVLPALVAFSSGGCNSGTTITVDRSSPDLKKSLNRKYPELENPPVAKPKKPRKK